MIKLLASDLDGTIIDSNNKINSYDLEAIDKLNSKSTVEFAVCTGNHPFRRAQADGGYGQYVYAQKRRCCGKFAEHCRLPRKRHLYRRAVCANGTARHCGICAYAAKSGDGCNLLFESDGIRCVTE